MRIAIITTSLAGGGVERASSSMANQFAKWGHDVHIVTLYKRERFLPIDERIEYTEPTIGYGKKSYVLYMMSYVRKQIKRIKPDTILAYNEWTNPYVLFALQDLNYPLYVSDRMSPLMPSPLLTRVLKKIYYKRAAGVIAQTEFAKRIISESNGVKRIKVISNPVNAIDAIPCDKQNYIVTVGRLTKEKGHRCLVEAFAKMQHVDWKLSIVGDGTEKASLVELVQKLGVSDRVIFHGHKLNFAKELSEAKIFVLPSLSEGFPNAVIEAMSVPLPCIATRCTEAMDEVVQNGVNGLLVEKENPDALATTIDRLIDNEELQRKLSINAYSVRENLAFEKIAKEYLDFITSHNNK